MPSVVLSLASSVKLAPNSLIISLSEVPDNVNETLAAEIAPHSCSAFLSYDMPNLPSPLSDTSADATPPAKIAAVVASRIFFIRFLRTYIANISPNSVGQLLITKRLLQNNEEKKWQAT